MQLLPISNVFTSTLWRRQARPVAVLLAAVLSGCASHHRPGEPIVDLAGGDPIRYERDLGECRQFAEQVALGTRVGAGAAADGNSDTGVRGAGVGAASGTFRGAADGLRERSQVVKNCLRQRGYRVLN